jgi:hypothetical protein
VQNTDCTSDILRPQCEPSSHTCVACTTDEHCGPNAPQCDTSVHECVQCLESDDCATVAGKPVCNTDAHACVECNADADCGDPQKARCEEHVCEACTADAQCTHLSATPVCDEPGRRCVACTADTEAQRCGSKACKRSTGECTDKDRGGTTACGTCEADSECVTGARCVVHRVSNQDLGSFCFFDSVAQGGCADTVGAVRPYSQPSPTPLGSIDGVTATYCLPPTATSCKGIADAIAGGVGAKACTTNDDCGEPNVSDGFCIDSGPAMGQCSYNCINSYECPQSGFTSCPAMPSFCQP